MITTICTASRFLSTLSLRRATAVSAALQMIPLISIHALLAESDQPTTSRNNKDDIFLSTLSLRRATVHYDNYNLHCVISIHALLAESDIVHSLELANPVLFLSTLSLRRATSTPRFAPTASRNFYPRSPCGERRGSDRGISCKTAISIHALLAESDA